YRQRISGPLLDRIDLHIEVPSIEYRDMASERSEEPSSAIRERVSAARKRQQARFANDSKTNCNARMGTKHLKQWCKLDSDSQELIRVAMTELHPSARAYDRILKVARNIADLASTEDITAEHVSEAIQYRSFDRTLWVWIFLLPWVGSICKGRVCWNCEGCQSYTRTFTRAHLTARLRQR